jgi:hypothetical protein
MSDDDNEYLEGEEAVKDDEDKDGALNVFSFRFAQRRQCQKWATPLSHKYSTPQIHHDRRHLMLEQRCKISIGPSYRLRNQPNITKTDPPYELLTTEHPRYSASTVWCTAKDISGAGVRHP